MRICENKTGVQYRQVKGGGEGGRECPPNEILHYTPSYLLPSHHTPHLPSHHTPHLPSHLTLPRTTHTSQVLIHINVTYGARPPSEPQAELTPQRSTLGKEGVRVSVWGVDMCMAGKQRASRFWNIWRHDVCTSVAVSFC